MLNEEREHRRTGTGVALGDDVDRDAVETPERRRESEPFVLDVQFCRDRQVTTTPPLHSTASGFECGLWSAKRTFGHLYAGR